MVLDNIELVKLLFYCLLLLENLVMNIFPLFCHMCLGVLMVGFSNSYRCFLLFVCINIWYLFLLIIKKEEK